MQRPCKCGHIDLKHNPVYMHGRNIEQDRCYTHCYICNDGHVFKEMLNLDYLEYLYTKNRKGEINV